MTLGATFLAGAKGRLLPPSIPFRYFAAAAFFHGAFWLLLLLGAGEVAGFAGGPGLPLAALHMLTLGVLAMTAMGAAFQLLPVASRQALSAAWPARLGFWLIVPGVLAFGHGAATGTIWVLGAGAALAGAALVVMAATMAFNLRGARDMAAIRLHGWLAILSLVAIAGLGLALVADFEVEFLANHGGVATAHAILGGYGFMGMLALGFSQLLVPMFALSPAPSPKLGLAAAALAALALVLGVAGALLAERSLLLAAAGVGLAAAAAHLTAMAAIMRARMRKSLGFAFLLVRLAWVMLPVSLVLGALALLGLLGPRGHLLFGLALLGGWLMTFTLAILQKIMPFLAAMHGSGKGGKAPLVSELSPELPLKLHAAAHVAALALLAAGIGFDLTLLVRAGAALGLAGALGFAVFAGLVVWRAFGRARAAGPEELATGDPAQC